MTNKCNACDNSSYMLLCQECCAEKEANTQAEIQRLRSALEYCIGCCANPKMVQDTARNALIKPCPICGLIGEHKLQCGMRR